jgi:hypothetical protein
VQTFFSTSASHLESVVDPCMPCFAMFAWCSSAAAAAACRWLTSSGDTILSGGERTREASGSWYHLKDSSDSAGRQRLGQSLEESSVLGTALLSAAADDDVGTADLEANEGRPGAVDAALDAGEGLLSFKNSFESLRLPFILPSPAAPRPPFSLPVPPWKPALPPLPRPLPLPLPLPLPKSSLPAPPLTLLSLLPPPLPRLNLNCALGISLVCRKNGRRVTVRNNCGARAKETMLVLDEGKRSS